MHANSGVDKLEGRKVMDGIVRGEPSSELKAIEVNLHIGYKLFIIEVNEQLNSKHKIQRSNHTII